MAPNATAALALKALVNRPMAMEPGALRSWVTALQSPETLTPRAATRRTQVVMIGGVGLGVLPIVGVIEYRPSFLTEYGYGTAVTNTIDGLREHRAARDVSVIVLVVDSPGGGVDGLPELAFEVRETRRVKPVVAVVDPLAASAAFWIATQADAILGSTSAQVGSQGVYCAHTDISRALDQAGVTVTLIASGAHKVDGNEFQPLPPDVRDRIQADADRVNAQFIADIVAGRQRGLTPGKVRSGFGGGLMFDAAQARARGMMDLVFPTITGAMAHASGAAERRQLAAAAVAGDLALCDYGTPAERRAAAARLQTGAQDEAARAYQSMADGELADEHEVIRAVLDADRAMLASLSPQRSVWG